MEYQSAFVLLSPVNVLGEEEPISVLFEMLLCEVFGGRCTPLEVVYCERKHFCAMSLLSVKHIAEKQCSFAMEAFASIFY
ncbi:hypothetical protein BON30_48595 [Cystobacter ferrugineus]|uniref:Uncharacterized protein n=1 Tax=Cystobacter ferrugineus TaxID=83449 RepID=A0A1L9ATW4_9BACT|nr:hypothetical protein BON30_48595 [Cystobacter ferrugineus]